MSTATDLSTAPELTVQQRNQQMVERYAAGETLESIGSSFGVTRERVRQIVSKLGGTSAEESRKNRLAARESASAAARAAFLLEYGQLARRIAATGAPRAIAVERIRALYPSVDAGVAEEALRESDIVFDKLEGENIFSDEVVAAGVWYLLGSDLGLGPDLDGAAAELPLEVITDLKDVLAAASVEPDDIATILGVIAAAQEHVAQHPEATITGQRYGALRDELIPVLGLESRKGATPWPPTRQTIQKRFGGWNDGLAAIGLGTSARGRSKGLLKFTEDDYREAMNDFVADPDRKRTVESYHEWVVMEGDVGRTRPSVASIRNVFGSWGDAVRAGLAAGRPGL
ncbi:sigma factor-like helix-turn-helix DNA-binding protein [Sinomonas sp. B1-1]|uniref:sigma factor-like helix-turn-helix DNA-binding protein n=1 Tax=Sinomonas sp. B1-1 TaxID=3141454 RepID=UPI003D2A403C